MRARADNKAHDAFPTGTRHNVTKSTWAAFTRLGFSVSDLTKKLLCDGDLQTNELLLKTYPYARQTDRGTAILEKLGYDFKRATESVVVCRPVLVKMCM